MFNVRRMWHNTTDASVFVILKCYCEELGFCIVLTVTSLININIFIKKQNFQ